MLCIIAPTFDKAQKWASSQLLLGEEWFYCGDEIHLAGRRNFHVIVVGDLSDERYNFEQLYRLARIKGRTK